MQTVEDQQIAIIGGGPGGLTLARLLQLQGADVRVYERDRSRDARVQGSALDLHEDSGLAALEAAGLIGKFWENYRPDLNQLRLTDPQGNILHDHARNITGEHKRPEIERGPLRDLLLDSLAPGTVVWDRKLESAVFAGGKVVLRFTGGDDVTADLVIGADGANSRLRALVTPIRPKYVGVSLIEGVVYDGERAVPELWKLLEGSAVMALGGEHTLGMGTKPDGSILFYAGLKSPEQREKASIETATTAEERVAWFHANFSGWSALWEPLFAKATSLIWRPLLCCPPDQRWQPHANVTLLGDAAHVIPPYAGEGVNMAMLDALVLSQKLANANDVTQAIGAYEDEMFARMKPMADETMANTEMFYAPDAAEQVVDLFRSFGRGRPQQMSNANTAEHEISPSRNE